MAWYNVSSGGTSISSSSNYTTASISTTTTYYVESKTAALQGSCISAGRTEVIAIVNANPSAPLAVNASRCGAGSIQVGATPSDNQTIDWYAAATGTTPAFKIAALTLDTNVTTANRLFYAASRDLTTGCLSSVRTTVTATYNALPSAVTTVVNAARCGEGALNLSATAPTGSTLHWYADSLISENPLFIGNAYTTPSLSATTIYWVVSKSTAGCYATSLKRVTATINAVPSAPIATGNTRCGAGTLSLTAIAPIGGSVAWYNVSSGGTSLSVASNYTTATLTTSTTYYVESKTASSLGSCVSLNRTEVIATVNTNPASPLASNASRCGPGAIQVGAIPSDNQVIDWYAASTGTALPFKVGFSTIDTNVTTSNRVFYAAARDLTNGCSSPVRTTVTATYNAYPANLTTATNASKCNPDTATISATALSGMTIDWYADSTLNTLLQSGSTSGVNKFITPFINSSTNYWAVQRNVTSGCLSPVSKKVTVTINVTPDAPASSNKERCGSGTVVLTAVPPQGSSVAWFNVSTGGTSLSTTLSYTTPSLSSTTTYYVESRAAGPCISVTRTPVIATVNSVPSAPTAVNASRCGPGSIQLMANPASTNDQTIDWYAAATGTVPAFKMNSLVLDTSITATKLYYAASRNIATGCLSATRTTVTATFNALPAAVTTVVNGARCGEGTLNLSATPQTGASIEWYPDSNRVGTLLNTGNTFTTPLLTSTNLYWLVSKSTAGCYSASSKRITASINQIPSAPVANGNARCSTGTVLLTAVAPVGGTVGWYNVSSGGTSLSSLVSYTTPSLTTTTTYFAEAKTAAAAGSCISSTRTMVIALINDRPLPPTAINDARCGAGLVKPSGIPLSNQNQVIDWYAASTGTTAPFKTSALILDTIVSSTKTFYIASRNTSTGCVSNNRVAVLGIINSSAPTLASASITSTLVSDVCGARIYRYTAAAVSGANSYNWTLPNNGSYIDSGSNGNVVKVLYPSNQATVLTDSIKVNAVNACGTGPSRALKVNLTQCILPTGKIQTEEIKSTEEINASIYPNPTFNRFNLNVNSSSIEIVSVRILDVQGRLVRAIKIKPNQINEIGSEFTPGIYFFEIRQGHRIKTKKVIKY